MVENILPSATLSINTLRDVNHLMERLIEEWRDLDHNIICEAVNQWRRPTRLRACWWRALWTATTTVTDIYRLNWYERCSLCWKLAMHFQC